MRKLSECCDAPMDDRMPDTCTACQEHCGSYEEYDCDECKDTGIVTKGVYDEHGAMVDEFTKKCFCRMEGAEQEQ